MTDANHGAQSLMEAIRAKRREALAKCAAEGHCIAYDFGDEYGHIERYCARCGELLEEKRIDTRLLSVQELLEQMWNIETLNVEGRR